MCRERERESESKRDIDGMLLQGRFSMRVKVGEQMLRKYMSNNPFCRLHPLGGVFMVCVGMYTSALSVRSTRVMFVVLLASVDTLDSRARSHYAFNFYVFFKLAHNESKLKLIKSK